MKRQRTFFMLKPDGIPIEAEITAKILPVADIIATKEYRVAPLEKIRELYSEHKEKLFYPWIFNYFRNRPIKVMILEEKEVRHYKNSFIEEIIDIVGNTDPGKAKQHTIRSMSKDDVSKAFKERRVVRNLVHRSISLLSSLREGSIFFAGHIYDQSKIIRRAKTAQRLLKPLGATLSLNHSIPVSGIFFEERLENLLRNSDLILPGEEFISYRERNSLVESKNGRDCSISVEIGIREVKTNSLAGETFVRKFFYIVLSSRLVILERGF